MNVTLIPYEDGHIIAFRDLYESAFPCGERKSLDFLLEQKENGIYDLWIAEDEHHTMAGLLTTVKYADFVLLDYLAVLPSRRGRGIGHRMLEAARRQYPEHHLFLEIEVPRDDADNAEERKRRLAFYLDAGLVRTGVQAHLYGDLMELLAYPQDAPYITFDLYRDMLTATFPPHMIPVP